MNTKSRNNNLSFINAAGQLLSNVFEKDDVVMTKKMPVVLLFDENPIDGFIGRKMLEKTGIDKPVIFDKPNEVLNFLLNVQELPDFMLIDNSLPGRNGFDLYEKIMKLELPLQHTRFFFLSNFLEFSDNEKARQLNIFYIEKPLTPEKLAILRHGPDD